MAITENQILTALKTVDDPDLKKDLVTLNMIKDIRIEGKVVFFTVVLTTPACPLKEKIRQDCLNAVSQVVGKEVEIQINMTSQVTSQNKNQRLTEVKNVIAVVSGKGGVGKSTIATNLAVALARSGASVGLVDADIYGPSMPIMFGLQGERPYVAKVGDKDMIIPFDKEGVKLNSIGFLVAPEQAIVWRGPMASRAMNQLIFDTDWGPLDYMIIDMPPGTGDIHLSLVQALPLTGVVVVTTPQDVALADARKGAQMFQTPQINVPILGVVENMSYFSPEDMPEKKYFLFGQGGGMKLATELKVPLLAELPMVEKTRESGDKGQPPAADPDTALGKSFASLAENVAQQVALRNAQVPPTEQVKILTN
ncbi:MAG: Mrp/NBP35 family ATP-binding protein [Bacteroidia bacterium]|nr:Mrp/NBP35 family ATP-binding protein [Bacteroidia bacterium]